MASTAAAASVFTSSAAAAASALASSAAASSVFASFATAALALTSSEATASALACSAEELLPVALQRSLQQHTPILSTKIVCQSSITAQNFLFLYTKNDTGLIQESRWPHHYLNSWAAPCSWLLANGSWLLSPGSRSFSLLVASLRGGHGAAGDHVACTLAPVRKQI